MLVLFSILTHSSITFCQANQTMKGILNLSEEGNLLRSLEQPTPHRQTTHRSLLSSNAPQLNNAVSDDSGVILDIKAA